jgi:hypothetical protein
LIRDAHLYHVSNRPDGVHWDGVEYWDPVRKRGVVYAFRGSIANEAEHRFVLAGLEPLRRYRLHFEDGTSSDRETTGAELMKSGLAVSLSEPFSSELIFLKESDARGHTLEEHQIRQRLETGKRRRLDPQLDVSEVSDRCGFSNPAYFVSVFKKQMHCTPRADASQPETMEQAH